MSGDEPSKPHLNGANGANGALHDHDADDDPGHAHDHEEEPAPIELAPAPDVVNELAASCVRFVLSKYRVALDFTPDTLPLVDQYVRDARAEVIAKPEMLDLLSATIGAYLGEVIRRALDANWYVVGEHDGWRLDMTTVFLTFNPIGMAREAITLGESEGWHAHLETDEGERESLDDRLRALPEVSDDEFYAPTTRFDVVEIAVEALAAKMRSNALGDVRFTSDDYRKK